MKNIKFKDIAFMVIGTFLMAVAISQFYSPNNLVTGGVSGIAILVNKISNIPIWLTTFILNVPLFLFGMRVHGRLFIIRTLFCTVLFTFFIYLTEFIPPITYDLALASIFGAVLSGLGLGLVFLAKGSTGGTDLATTILHKYMPHFSLAGLIFTLDSVIILFGLFLFGLHLGLYAIIAVFISSKALDAVLEGFHFAKAVFIISNHSDDISKSIISTLKRGATNLHGRGVYTGKEKNVILCVVAKKQILALKELVSRIDPHSFIIVADVREVLGEGFNEDNKNLSIF
jgi:uncharacterized membrane-anchored protein YitT (DUF2179 family)